ncbi:hypothetical protein GQ651_15820 [Alphaproteobacteria bacterium GH1-50]|uniref:Thiol:disulfide interchange protein DsbD N-terminal domain-containing protein n=1 Tax=Kangsaoukella pontilimi TaxID=2691042 RepID=A0A7C9MCB7_9RHOB|nr:protein-disulfide reductase DsbD domain-containing protein [Kangsaoukella pontilimi]MXQ09313.1 hypothetical protein [Kangsaoukella pontilimi]
MNRLAPLVLAMAAASALPAFGQVPDNVARIEVLPGWRDAGGRHHGALDIQLAPGWKTYWRAPGEGGIPPLFNWSGSKNLAALDVSFPVPSVLIQNGMRSFGYEDRVMFPFTVTPEKAGDDVILSGQIELGVCYDICIPVSVSLSALLPADASRPDPRIKAAFSDKPATADEAGLDPMGCRIEPIADGMRVTATLGMAPMGGDEVAVMEHPDPTIWVSEATLTRDGNRVDIVAEMVPPAAKPFLLARDSVRVTVLAGGGAVEITGCQ